MGEQLGDERCRKHDRDGHQCQRRALVDSSYCYPHDEEVRRVLAGTPRPA